MDYSSQHGLSRFTGRKMMIFLFGLLLCSTIATTSTAILTENENAPGTQSTTEATKAEISKREEPAAQRREHSFNADGTVNYHGSGSGHDSGDLVPPPGGSGFSSPSISISIEHTGASGPSGLSNSYGVPIPSDSYGPPKNIFGGIKPPSSFGPPGGNHYLPPKQNYGPPSSGPPKPVYGPPKPHYRPPSPPKPHYGPPQFGPPKPTYGAPKPIRPKPSFSSRPKPVYGPPKPSFGSSGFSHGTRLSPVGGTKSHFGPPKISATYGTPLQPSTSYGPPKHPKPGHVNAPPTPPEVTYDGWKPIPGLSSSPPSGSYGVPESTGHGISGGGGFSSVGHISSSGFDSSGSGFGSLSPPSSSYGAPSFGGTSFGSSGFGIQLKPVSTYGPPSKPSPTYGIPLQPSTSYGPPSGFKGSSKGNFFSSFKAPSSSYGPPTFSHGPSKPGHSFGSLKPPSSSYGLPQISSSFGPPKGPSSSYGPPKPPRPSYGPPKPPSISYGPPKPPRPSYGPPKPPSISYGPPKTPSSSYGPPKPPSISYGPPKAPSSSYGPPKFPSSSFGPPSVPHSSYGPPSGISGSFTPPKPPSNSYGPPKPPSSSYGPPKPPGSSYGPPPVFTSYSIPKPGISISSTPNTAYRGPSVPHPLQPPSFGAPAFTGGLYKAPLPPNALYGVPTAPAPPTSIGFDFGFQGLGNTFGVPNLDLHAPTVQQVPSIDIGSQFNSFSSGGLSQTYGTPLFPPTPPTIHHPPASTYGVPTALPLRQPKNPVKFRPPVPAGLISSIGAKWGDSAVWGGTSESHKFHGNTYIPPAVPDPDPGIRANHGNPLVIPPPSAPPINYGPPQNNQHSDGLHHSSNQFTSSAPSGHGEGDLNPPPPAVHGQGSFDIQQSASVELHGSNNLDHHGGINAGSISSGGVTSYNAPVDISSSHHHGPESSSVSNGHNFGGVQNIPIKGNQGSYTLQIQSAGGNSGDHVPHSEVLSNGLLQDILAAIENPSASGQLQQYNNQHTSDPVASEIGLNILKQLGGNDVQQSNSIQLPSQYGSDLSHSSSINVPQYAKTSSDTGNEVFRSSVTEKESTNSTEGGQNKIAHYLNQNKIALYYNNQEESEAEDRKGDGKDILLVQMLLPNNSTNTQTQNSEFGGLVSFNLPNAQSNNSTLQTQKVS